MDQLTRLRAFVAVVEQGGFSAAAKELGRSKALISKYVGDLEDSLGVRLLNRTTRRIGVTETGRAYYETCTDILARLDDLNASVRESECAMRGRLRVSAPSTFGERHLIDSVLDFMQTYPDIAIDLSLTDRFVDLIEEGYDVAVRIAALPDSSLVARKLTESPAIVYATPAYLAAHGKPEEPADLSRHDCIIDTNLSAPRTWLFERDGERTFTAVNGRLVVDNLVAAHAACLRGFGIARCPAFMAESAIAQGTVVPLLDGWKAPEAAIHVVYPHRQHLSRRVRAFVDHLAQRFRGGAQRNG